ncbi:MAG: sulfite exporter TauE/SafE family protein [Deltaproteobacteria bacterium]|nr:sulfite exporter TauE/SafE family protein [Deltaproteobacteria bacterium]
MALVLAVLSASLFGSLHCAAMCGGLVGFAAGSGGRGSISAYHLGRLLAYGALGALAGELGQLINHAGARADVGGLAAFLAGTLMISVGIGRGLSIVGARRGSLVEPKRSRPNLGASLLQLSTRAARRASSLSPWLRAGALGLTTAVLPCGWLWAFVATAAATGSGLEGALAMAAFWAGTLPVLVGLGLGVDRILGRLRRHVPMGSAVVLVAAGLFTLLHRIDANLPGASRDSPTEQTCHRP